jgi:hypothetical protein
MISSNIRRALVGGVLVVLVAAFTLISVRLDWWQDAPSRSPLPFTFTEDFERARELAELFPSTGERWHGVQCQPEGNRVELSSEQAHSGTKSLKLTAQPYDGKNTTKADLQRGGLPFVEKDEVWFSGWFYLMGGTDAAEVFLWDLETSRKRQSPGRRLYLSGECLASDLGKWWSGQTFRQAPSSRVPFSKDRWVQLRVHLLLSADKNGTLEVWHDATKVLNARGQTLPTSKAVYDRFQVGVTANGNRHSSQVLYIDDIALSNRELE